MTLQDLRNNPEYWKQLETDLKATRERKEQVEDDYYEQLGELIEEHPIVSPIRR